MRNEVSAVPHNPAAQTTAERWLVTMHALLGKIVSSPWAHDVLDLTLATRLSVRLTMAQNTPPVWLLFIARPSSGKTEGVDLLKADDRTKYVTTLTPEAFASGAYDPATKKHAASLLPELNGKCLATRDLTTVLSLKGMSRSLLNLRTE